jgi:hypothetical protein
MANLQKSTGSQLSRGQREARAFRTIQVGVVTGVGFVVTTILSIAGVMGDHPPIVLAAATVICGVRFRYLTRKR